MKCLFSCFTILFIGLYCPKLLASACISTDANVTRVATFNILTNYAPHSVLYPSWAKRSKAIATWVREQKISILGTQEGMPDMIADIKSQLPNFGAVGRARSESTRNGETVTIFYDRRQYESINNGDFWLSETPDLPGSKGWDAAIERVCTWVHLRNRQSQEDLFVFNVHFDHLGFVARRESARLVLAKMLEIAGQNPQVLTGDFNATPASEPISIIKSQLNESREHSITPPMGPEHTYDLGLKLDYVFSQRRQGNLVCSHQVQAPRTAEGRVVSDHRAALADLYFSE